MQPAGFYKSLIFLLYLLFSFFVISCSSSSSHSREIAIVLPSADATVTGLVEVSGKCSGVDSLTVVIDDDSYTRQRVDCSHGNWSAEFDTGYFQDGEHVVVAFEEDVSDQVRIVTENGNVAGITVSVPVRLDDSIYDEIDSFTPLYVFAKKISTGRYNGKRFYSGNLPGVFELDNLPNGLYQIGAFLDRNNNQRLDEQFDFYGTASQLLEVSNVDEDSGEVVLEVYSGPDNSGFEAGIFNPSGITGDIGISTPIKDSVVSGLLTSTGNVSGRIENIQVLIDNNQFTARMVDVRSSSSWSAEFDTTRLQDGLHTLTARANEEIEDSVVFYTDNGNVQGYSIETSVELSPGISGEVSSLSPLIVYVEHPITGARQIMRFDSGELGPESSFIIHNVPNNIYRVGAYLDRNNNGIEDGGDYSGSADDLLTVWYGDAQAAVTLHGNEIHIGLPEWGTEIRTDHIDLTGTYLGDPEEIEVLMRYSGVSYREAVNSANFNGGTWSATLDITDVTEEGDRWLHVRARYGSRYLWDSVQVLLNRNFPRGIEIHTPEDGSTISTNSFTTSGTFDGDPDLITLYLDRGTPDEITKPASMSNIAWSASFNDLTGVETGFVQHTLTAVADYGEGITEEDMVTIYIDPVGNHDVSIDAPTDGETLASPVLPVSGRYTGIAESIEVSLVDSVGGTQFRTVSSPADGVWNVQFDDISLLSKGSASLTATASFTAGDTEVDSVAVTIDLPVSATELTITSDIPYLNEGLVTYFIINANDELSLDTTPDPPTPLSDNALVMTLSETSDTHASFDAGSDWTMQSRSHANPVSETVVSSYILQRNSGGDYYKITVDFTITSGAAMQFYIGSIGAWNCGTSVANCP